MSIKLKINWIDNNVIVDGVRIYKNSAIFDVNTLPAVYAEITDGSIFYEDLAVIEGQTYFYMMSCFLGEREVFTECFEVKIIKDTTKTLAIVPSFFVAGLWVSGFDSETGDFKVWKSGITDSVSSMTNSMKVYCAPFRKAVDGAFYYELICTRIVNNVGADLTVYRSDDMFGLAQNGAIMNINSSGSGWDNTGYGKFILRNYGENIQGVGALVGVASIWSTKLSSKQLQLNQIWGIGIRASGSNTLVELWIDGVYQGVMFTIAGTSIELRPLIIFTLENNYIKATHYKYPRVLTYLPDGFESWLTN